MKYLYLKASKNKCQEWFEKHLFGDQFGKKNLILK